MRAAKAAICFLLLFATQIAPAAPLDPARIALAEQELRSAIERGEIPGAVLLIGTSKEDLHFKAYGNRAVKPEAVPMTADTIFDAASLSKPVGCATSVMLLIERGKIRLDDPVSKYLPAFAQNGKENITVAQLLLHRGGLIPDNSLNDYREGPVRSIERIHALSPQKTPGTAFMYTDVGYIVLGELVKAVDGRPLDEFAQQEIFEPLGMKETFYKVPQALRSRTAPTEQREGRWMQGEVHDPRAYALGGVAGHAGLFTTAADLARYCRMVLAQGQLDGKRILSESTIRDMTTSRALPDGTGARSYAYDVDTGYSSARGDRFHAGSTFGHTGFTGTMFWIDPSNDCFVILLTNRVHPDGKGQIVSLRRRVVTHAAEALLGAAPIDGRRNDQGAPANVLAGIDVLKRDNFKALDGRKIALITNHTGRDREGNRLVDILHSAKNLTLVRLFSPEHGLYGVLDEKVGHGIDEKTGLKVFSLYGETRRPTKEMLEGIDTLVFDIQDVGTRFYTYVSTMGICMEEAAKHNIRMVVLDRPNPITGLIVDGPVADKSRLSFTAYAQIPLVHGMTVGELATMFNTESNLKCDLTVIKCENWRRAMWFDETGLTWVNPSPNMRNATQALLYPSIGLIEFSNVSVGRGTDQPFEIFGAPWIDGRKLAAALDAQRLPGLRFIPIEFTPKSSKHAGKLCHGVYIIVTDRNITEPARTGVTIAWLLEHMFPDDYQQENVARLMHSDSAMKALMESDDPRVIPLAWREELAEFKKTRAKYLLYK